MGSAENLRHMVIIAQMRPESATTVFHALRAFVQPGVRSLKSFKDAVVVTWWRSVTQTDTEYSKNIFPALKGLGVESGRRKAIGSLLERFALGSMAAFLRSPDEYHEIMMLMLNMGYLTDPAFNRAITTAGERKGLLTWQSSQGILMTSYGILKESSYPNLPETLRIPVQLGIDVDAEDASARANHGFARSRLTYGKERKKVEFEAFLPTLEMLRGGIPDHPRLLGLDTKGHAVFYLLTHGEVVSGCIQFAKFAGEYREITGAFDAGDEFDGVAFQNLGVMNALRLAVKNQWQRGISGHLEALRDRENFVRGTIGRKLLQMMENDASMRSQNIRILFGDSAAKVLKLHRKSADIPARTLYEILQLLETEGWIPERGKKANPLGRPGVSLKLLEQLEKGHIGFTVNGESWNPREKWETPLPEGAQIVFLSPAPGSPEGIRHMHSIGLPALFESLDGVMGNNRHFASFKRNCLNPDYTFNFFKLARLPGALIRTVFGRRADAGPYVREARYSEMIESAADSTKEINKVQLLLQIRKPLTEDRVEEYWERAGLRQNPDRTDYETRRDMVDALTTLFATEAAAIRTVAARDRQSTVLSLKVPADGKFTPEQRLQFLNAWRNHDAAGGKDFEFHVTFTSEDPKITPEDAMSALELIVAGHPDSKRIQARVRAEKILKVTSDLNDVYRQNKAIFKDAGDGLIVQYLTEHELIFLSRTAQVIYRIIAGSLLLRMPAVDDYIEGVRLIKIQA